jgi:hypothetical protein
MTELMPEFANPANPWGPYLITYEFSDTMMEKLHSTQLQRAVSLLESADHAVCKFACTQTSQNNVDAFGPNGRGLRVRPTHGLRADRAQNLRVVCALTTHANNKIAKTKILNVLLHIVNTYRQFD